MITYRLPGIPCPKCGDYNINSNCIKYYCGNCAHEFNKITKNNITNKRYYLNDGQILEIKGKGFRIKHNKIFFYAKNLNNKYRKYTALNIKDIIKIENI